MGRALPQEPLIRWCFFKTQRHRLGDGKRQVSTVLQGLAAALGDLRQNPLLFSLGFSQANEDITF